MKTLSRFNPSELLELFGRLATLLLVLTLAWRAAYWVAQFAAPAPQASAPNLRGEINLASVNRFAWLGEEATKSVAAAAANSAAIGIRLIGVYAGGPRPVAIVALGAQNPIAVAVGEELAPGVKLTAVAADHIKIDRNGAVEQVALPVQTASIDATPGASPSQATSGKETARK
ncbi:MAG TPA: type II secretion system protein N [Rhodocyclaceae bacterium]|nr:type II secretion system protein N [Rhodocyclaceae bacterium]